MFKVLIFILTTSAFTHAGTICGDKDERRLSFEHEVGRAVKMLAEVGCTLTMISKTCAVSAGHCLNDLKSAQFNTYLNNGILVSAPQDTYVIDQASIVSQNSGHGKDWAVFRLQKNSVSELYAGEVQGYLKLNDKRMPVTGDDVTITGFGWNSHKDMKNAPQRSHTSTVMAVDKQNLYYDVDTMGGNSGSAIVNHKNEIIGIHTHGYCSEDGGANQGTLLATSNTFKKAIEDCLLKEKLLVD